MPKIKICCISSKEEARMAKAAGADILGFVGPMPSGPGILELDEIAIIVKTFKGRIQTCLLTSSTDYYTIIKEIKSTDVDIIQLVQLPPTSTYEKIRSDCQDIKIIQVIHIEGSASIEEAQRLDGQVDYFLLDSGNPSEDILGGTGKVHNWEVSKSIIEGCKTPVFLAGGMQSDNVISALDLVRPFGVDLCSGVRTNDKLDPSKLHRFFKQIQKMSVWEG